MSLLDRVFPKRPPVGAGHQRPAPAGRNGSAAAQQPNPAIPQGSGANLPPGGGAAVVPADLSRRRDQLADELAELQWDLGGLTYEMAIRDHFRPDVLMKVAARLQRVDAEMGEVERLMRLERGGAAGECSACGALHSRGAVYCWQCGSELMAELRTSKASRPQQSD
jgi:hypothetical protein